MLITGGSGILGTALRNLEGEKIFYDRVERSPLLEGETYIQADVRDRDRLREAMADCKILIHCAGSMGQQENWDKSQNQIMLDNIEGLAIAFDAAKEFGLERIIFASSNHAVGMFEVEGAPAIYEYGHNILIDENVPTRPDSFYGVSKVFGEAYGRFIAENCGPRCYALRIGSVRSENEDHPYAYAEWGVRKGKWERGSREYAVQEKRLKALWMSRRDFVQMVRKVLRYDGPHFEIFNAVSNNDRKWFDMSHAQKALGFSPQDNSEGWVQIMTEWSRNTNGEVQARESTLRVTALIPVRVEQNDDLDFVRKLIICTVNSARECPAVDRVVLTTDNAILARESKLLGLDLALLRPPELSAPDVRADTVLQFAVSELEALGLHSDLIAPLEITYPFRPAGLISRLLEKLLTEKLNTAIVGYPERRPCWIRRDGEVIRIDEYAKLRENREPLHIGLSSLGCITYTEFVQKGSRFGTHIGVLELEDQLSAVEIRNFRNSELFDSLQNARSLKPCLD